MYEIEDLGGLREPVLIVFQALARGNVDPKPEGRPGEVRFE